MADPLTTNKALAQPVVGSDVGAWGNPVNSNTGLTHRGAGLTVRITFLRSTTMRDQKDPNRVLTLVVFESEEKARARENDPRRQEGLQAVRAAMAEVFEGAPEFIDLTIVEDTTV